MHDRFLNALKSIASVRLVSCLQDERLGFPDTNDLRIFIPDLHLITEARFLERKYRYRTNFTGLLTQVVQAIAALRAGAAAGEMVVLYQMGDFLDLWREAPRVDAQLDVASRIKDDHDTLVSALLDPDLKTGFLLGNHDFDLYRAPDNTGARRFYIPDSPNRGPSAIVLHGDVFDWVEKLPQGMKEIMVFVFGPAAQPQAYQLGMMKLMRDKVIASHDGKTYQDFIQNELPAPVGGLRQAGSGDVGTFNIQREGVAPSGNLLFLDEASKYCAQSNRDYNFNLKVAIIGHTHHARIAVRETAEGGLFTLIDTGAWIENCIADGDTTPSPNAQIAALCGNDARIYQLAPLNP